MTVAPTSSRKSRNSLLRLAAERLRVDALSGPAAAQLATGLTVFAVVTTVAAADGGYFPRTWGWITLALAWVAAAGFALRRRLVLTRPAALMVVAVAAFVAWAGLSVLWAGTSTRGALEVERGVIYVAALLALFACLSARRVSALLYGLGTALVVISAYSLATMLFPERYGVADEVAQGRLSAPFGYPSAIGIFAAMGLPLAVAVVAEASQTVTRALAGFGVVVTGLTIYLSFSRGAAGACALGLLVVIAVSPSRLRQVTAALLLAPWVAASVAVASRAEAIRSVDAPLRTATEQGHHVATYALLTGIGAAMTAVAFGASSRRFTASPRLRTAYACSLLAAGAVALLVVFAIVAPPWTLASRAADSFTAKPPRTASGDFNRRFLTLSGNRRYYWQVAWDDYRTHPLLGSGAGTFQRTWLQERPLAEFVRDAHSLYVEALSELGPFGLLLIVLALGTPLACVDRARGQPLAGAAAGSYAAFVVHAGIDWDWEMPAVTGTGLALGAALVVCATHGRGSVVSTATRAILVSVAVAVAGFGFFSAFGEGELRKADRALAAGKWSLAESRARTAARWQPWAAAPWMMMAQAQYGDERGEAALASLRRALSKDDGDWTIWLDLAQFGDDRAARLALLRAHHLNPRSPEVAALAASRNVRLPPP